MNRKQRVFVEEYLKCWNASEAARRAGYRGDPNTVGPRLLANVGIQAVVQKRIDEKAMSADEVLVRLGEHARGDMGDFLDIGNMGFVVDLEKAKELGLTHLIKKVKQHTTISRTEKAESETHTMEVELYDAQAALVKIGSHLKLFTEKSEVDVTLRIEGLADLLDKIYGNPESGPTS